MNALRMLIVLTLLAGVAYPLFVTAVAQLCWAWKAGGSLIARNGRLVGSELLAQRFESSRYFWPRPSAADFATLPSGASNRGPTSRELRNVVLERSSRLLAAHGFEERINPPQDMVHASGSGLDPHISPEGARMQIQRVAAARGLSTEAVAALVCESTERPDFGFLGEPRINVLKLNLALDKVRPQ